MTCDERLAQLSALLDGELASSEAADLTGHIATCTACARRLAELASLRMALADAVPAETVSPEFLARITIALNDAEMTTVTTKRPAHPWSRDLRSIILGIAGAGVAAALALMILSPANKVNDFAAVRDAALRTASLSAAGPQLIAPGVDGFKIETARRDVIAGHAAKVFVYALGNERLTLCTWKANGEPAHGRKISQYKGTTILYWNDGADEYWVAGRSPVAVLDAFVHKFPKHAV